MSDVLIAVLENPYWKYEFSHLAWWTRPYKKGVMESILNYSECRLKFIMDNTNYSEYKNIYPYTKLCELFGEYAKQPGNIIAKNYYKYIEEFKFYLRKIESSPQERYQILIEIGAKEVSICQKIHEYFEKKGIE